MKEIKHSLLAFFNQFVGMPRSMRLFLINVLVYGVTVEGINMVILNLYLLRLGYGTEFIGALNSAGLIVFAIVSLPIGAITRYSSRTIMEVGQIISVVALVGLPLAMYVEVGQATLLITLRIIGMIGLSAYFVHQIPLSMEITTKDWHDRAMAMTMATFSFSAFLGSWLGGLLPEWVSAILGVPLSDPQAFQIPFFVAAIGTLPGLLTIRMLRGSEVPDVDPEVDLEANLEVAGQVKPTSAASPLSGITTGWRGIAGLVVIILIVRALQTSGVGVIMTFANVYFDDALGVAPSTIGLVSGLGRLLGVPLSLTIPWMMGRVGPFNLVHISLALIVVLMIPMALIPFWPVAALSLIAINSMGSIRYLSFITFSMSLVSEKQRSLMSGVGEMAIGAGFSLTSLIGGYLIAWYGYRELFLFGAGMTTIGAIAFWLIFRRRVAKQMPTPTVA